MVDFKKLREAKSQTQVINPIDIFQRSPKPPGVNDLYGSQSQVLEEWFKRRNEKDLVIKLPTGGGKTLVGLLMAKSLLNEYSQPVIYLTPTNQLIDQIFAHANEYPFFSGSATVYKKGQDFPDSFLSGKSILLCTYNALFNSLSKFGVKGHQREIIPASAIILDDAHVAFSTVRDSFTITIQKQDKENLEDYQYLTNIFRNTFEKLGNIGTFDDVVKGLEKNVVLDVPYWDWLDKSDEVRQYLSNKRQKFQFVWEFLRDSFDYCYCLISSKAFAITPLFPLVDMIPTFANCPRRIFMSATINDDSAIVRTFDAAQEFIKKPITSKSSVGVSERMILVPEWMKLDYKKIENIPTMLGDLAKSISQKSLGTVILVPSETASKEWEDKATLANSTDKVTEWVKKLKNRESSGPVVFANRYDGIDLQGDSCRLLILDGLPRGSSEYDLYLASVFVGGFAFNSTLAQRIEQGMGRGARGNDDYCVVIITSKKLTAWLSRQANLNFLTSTTLAQFKMGEEISRNIKDAEELKDTINLCLNRDTEWTTYHAETLSDNLSDLAQENNQNALSLTLASTERKVFKLLRDGYFEKAINQLNKYLENNSQIESQTKGWLEQLAARIAYQWGKTDLHQEYQRSAYSDNQSLLRPQSSPPYIALTIPSQQSQQIINHLDEYRYKRGFLSNFDEIVSHLVPEASTNQFEQALADLGSLLGFATERPDNSSKRGPDVLWLLNNMGIIIEAKSSKKSSNPLNKQEFGQLLTSVEWFKANYPNCKYIPVSVLSNPTKTDKIQINEAKVLTFNQLNELISDSRQFFEKLCSMTDSKYQLIIRCENLLQDSNLQLTKFIQTYLIDFQDN